METYLGGEEGYTLKHLKSKLLNHYGTKITITSIQGKQSVVSFRDVAHKILQDKWYTERCHDEAEERIRIVKMAASIILDDIRLTSYDCAQCFFLIFARSGSNLRRSGSVKITSIGRSFSTVSIEL